MPSTAILSPSEAGKKLGVAASTVRYWIHTGKLKAARRHNGYWAVRERDVLAFVESLKFRNHKK